VQVFYGSPSSLFSQISKIEFQKVVRHRPGVTEERIPVHGKTMAFKRKRNVVLEKFAKEMVRYKTQNPLLDNALEIPEQIYRTRLIFFGERDKPWHKKGLNADIFISLLAIMCRKTKCKVGIEVTVFDRKGAEHTNESIFYWRVINIQKAKSKKI